MTNVRVALLGGRHLVHDELPVARGRRLIARAQVSDGELVIQHRLAERFILRREQRVGFGLVPRAQAELLARLCVFAVVSATAFVEDEPCFHALPFLVGNVK